MSSREFTVCARTNTSFFLIHIVAFMSPRERPRAAFSPPRWPFRHADRLRFRLRRDALRERKALEELAERVSQAAVDHLFGTSGIALRAVA